MTHPPAISFACVGLGNYASLICKLLQRHSDLPAPHLKLVAVCEPDQARHAQRIEALRDAGIRVHARYDDLLEEPVQALWLPLPIPLHRPFTEKALAAGKAVMCEKPAAGTVDDVDAMIAARDRHNLPVAIGFQQFYDPRTWQMKKQLVEGAIGKVRAVNACTVSARGDSYYQRCDWAGKLALNDTWILDSPIQNADAHTLAMAFFLAGDHLQSSAQATQVEAELYRGNRIESFDTASVRFATDTDVPVTMIATHACDYFLDSHLHVQGEHGQMFMVRDVCVIESAQGTQVLHPSCDVRDAMVQTLCRLIRGENLQQHCYASLENARAQVLAVNAAVQAAPIYDIPDAFLRDAETALGKARAVAGIGSLIQLCVQRQRMLHESGHFAWTQPAHTLDLRDYHHFAGPCQALS